MNDKDTKTELIEGILAIIGALILLFAVASAIKVGESSLLEVATFRK